VRCNCCGFEAVSTALDANRSASAPGAPDGTRTRRSCPRCCAPLFPDESAALFLDMLKLLGQFGLASNRRLVFGTTGEDA
jgi:hypothetical protein